MHYLQGRENKRKGVLRYSRFLVIIFPKIYRQQHVGRETCISSAIADWRLINYHYHLCKEN